MIYRKEGPREATAAAGTLIRVLIVDDSAFVRPHPHAGGGHRGRAGRDGKEGWERPSTSGRTW
jgi:hypothetical protein